MPYNLKTIQKVLLKRPPEVNFTQEWRVIHQEFGIGEPVGKKLLLKEGDYDYLEAEYNRITNKASLDFDFTQDRIEIASVMSDEKQSVGRVFGRFIKVAASHGRIVTHERGGRLVTTLPEYAYLNVKDPSRLDLSVYQRLLIIENGALMENIEALKEILPDAYTHDTLYLYRGHDKALPEVLALVEQLPNTITLGLYFDYDIAGLEMIERDYLSRARVKTQVLLPEGGQELQGAGNEGIYYKQQLMMDRAIRRRTLHPILQSHAEKIHQLGAVVMQETMVSRDIKLKAWKVKGKE